jgi:hypothetical protein
MVHGGGDIGGTGDGDAPRATRDVLSPTETEEAGMRDRSEGLSVSATPHRLRCVFDHEGTAIGAETHDPIHVCRNPEEMGGHDAERVAVDCARKQVVVEIERHRIEITQPDSQARSGDRRGHGKARISRDHDVASR